MNVGIIGAGFVGELHGDAIRQIPGLNIRGVCRTNKNELEKMARKFKAQAYEDYKNLLADRGIDIVAITTPHHLHTDIAVEAAQLGKHIMLEKPMALTLKECDKILDAVADAKVTLNVGFCNRFYKAYQKAKEIIDSGEIGSLVYGVATMSKVWMEENRRPWHLDRKTGGGMWLTAGIHCLDRLTWLMESEITAVSGKLYTRFHNQKADDCGMIFVRYANGSCGTIVSTGYQDGAPKHLTELTGTKGMISVDYHGISIGKNGKWRQVEDYSDEESMPWAILKQWQEFISSILNNTIAPVTGSYARGIMEAAFAAEASSYYDKEITLPLDKECELFIEGLIIENHEEKVKHEQP